MKTESPAAYIRSVIRRAICPTLEEHADLNIPEIVILYLDEIIQIVRKERPGVIKFGFGQWVQAMAR